MVSEAPDKISIFLWASAVLLTFALIAEVGGCWVFGKKIHGKNHPGKNHPGKNHPGKNHPKETEKITR